MINFKNTNVGNQFQKISDFQDPDDSEGRTYRQINNAKQHIFKVNDEVKVVMQTEITGLTRDCDGTPLYSTALAHGISEDAITPITNSLDIPTTQVKFKDVPVGGRIKEYGKIWVVLETYKRGLIIEYTGEQGNSIHRSRCCFTDPDEGITLDTEVSFLN
jgi:hypothetical protein